MVFQQFFLLGIIIFLIIILIPFHKKNKFPLINLDTEPQVDWATYIQLLRRKEREDKNVVERKSMFSRIREKLERRNQKDPA